VGCDNVKHFGDGPLFAHGGSGIILSRAALDKVMPILDTCIKRYKPCWAGDIKTALCMRDAGILLTECPNYIFNRDPPNGEFQFPKDACLRPITFHHLLPAQIQKLYDLEMELDADKDILNYGNTFADWNEEADGVIVSGNRQGYDYNNDTANSDVECMERCKQEKRCMAFTYIYDGLCWLKEGISALEHDSNSVTGHFGIKYRCLTTREKLGNDINYEVKLSNNI
jgi:hypothetical protein